MRENFKKFILRGNVVDMATGIIVGAAFTSIVKSLVDDIITPPLGLLLTGIDFEDLFVTLKSGNPAPPYISLAAAQKAGAITLNYGQFLNTVFSFLIIATVIFILVEYVMKLQKEKTNATSLQEMTKQEKLLTEIRDLLKNK
jgi:large conductance mechanosensitive channel